MDKLIPSLYKEYGKYVNSSRAFPLFIDGLKPVERRVLFSAYQIAREKFVKSAKIDGIVIGNYHPHGSAYSTCVQLVRQGFLDGQGNFGCNVGVDPVGAAAPRYTECKLNQATKDLAFKYLKHVTWGRSDLGEDEPKFLPTLFPLCLIGNEYTQGIGFGYKTFIPCYKISDLYKRLLWLLGKRKTEPIISPITDCNITASNKELQTLLTTGKAQISVQGIIEERPLQNKVILKSWPPGRKFESLLTKFSKELENQDIGFTDLSTTQTEIMFDVIKQRNREKIYNNLVSKLKEVIKGSISFETIVADENGNVKLMSIDNMLLETFKMFTEVTKNMLTFEINKIQGLINEYQLLLKVRPVLSKYFKEKIINDETIIKIANEISEDIKVIKALFSKYNINKLFSLNIDISQQETLLSELDTTLNKNLDQFVLDHYEVYK